MPKVTGPLFSLKARGQFGKALIFKRGGIVVNYFKPRNPNSAAQQAQREAFRNLYMAGLTQEQADLLYAAIAHLHDDRYSQLSHLHDARYSQLGHSHTSKVSYGAFLNGGTLAAGATMYAQPWGSALNASAWIVTLPQAGTMKNLVISTANAQPASGSLVVTLTKNGVDTSVVVTVAANGAANRYSDTSHSVSWAFGDYLGFKVKNNASATSAILVSAACELELATV